MANSGPNTNGSQFFITYAKQPHLNGLYTVFGRVIHGFEVLDIMEKVTETMYEDLFFVEVHVLYPLNLNRSAFFCCSRELRKFSKLIEVTRNYGFFLL